MRPAGPSRATNTANTANTAGTAERFIAGQYRVLARWVRRSCWSSSGLPELLHRDTGNDASAADAVLTGPNDSERGAETNGP